MPTRHQTAIARRPDENVSVIGLGLRQVQDALNQRADQLQREFIQLSERLQALGNKLLEVRGEEQKKLREQQLGLRARQAELAEEINLWRERARGVTSQRSTTALRAYLEELQALGEKQLEPSVRHALYLLDAPEEELSRLAEAPGEVTALSPAGRLIVRARTEYDLRGSDSAPRQRAAVEFANRPGLAQDDEIVEEIEAAVSDADPIVREVALLTLIQLYRFRAMRVAELESAHKAVQKLAALSHAASVPALVEVVENPRTGYVRGEDGTVEETNDRSRMVALLRLVEWHTPEAQVAVQGRQFDRNQQIAKAAKRALELFPGPWSGPLKQS